VTTGDAHVAKNGMSIKQAAAELGVSAKWVRQQIDAGVVTPARSSAKRNARYHISTDDLAALKLHADADPTAGGPALLARYNQLEAERANLLAQVAWERAIAQEQQKALAAEQQRAEKLAEELEQQRARIEALKSLSAWDRMRGRHKSI